MRDMLFEETPGAVVAFRETFTEAELELWEDFGEILNDIEDFHDHDEGPLPEEMLRELVVCYKGLVQLGYF